MRIKATLQTPSRSRSQIGSTVPATRVAGWSALVPTLVALPGRFALVGLDVVGGELKTRSRGSVQEHRDVRVKLQRCGWPHRGHGSFHELVDGLRSPRGNEHHVACLQDGADALGQAVLRTSSTFPPKNRALSLRVWLVKVLIRVRRRERGTWFVERADVPVGADPKNL